MFMPSFFIKLIELGITTACLVLQQYSYDLTDVSTLILCSGTYVGFILVLTGELVGEMVFAPLDVIQDVYFSVLGIAMFGTCGWILYTARSDPERNPRTDETCQAYAVALAALNVVVMVLDLRVSSITADAPCRMCQLPSSKPSPKVTDGCAGEMISGKQDPFIEAWWCGASAVLFGACAARTLQGWRYIPDCPRRSRARAAAICSLAATSVLIIDTLRVLCEDDGSSIASSEHKLTKARAPKLGLDFSGTYSSPINMTKMTSFRLNPAKVPIKDIPMTGGVNVKFQLNNTAPVAGDAPKISPQKLTLTKLPASCKPLRMAPKAMRSFW